VNSLKKFRRLTLTIAKNSAAGTKIGRTIWWHGMTYKSLYICIMLL
jgi:hypothetical protein